MNMISYFLNWMGPVSTQWYENNNIPYVDRVINSRFTTVPIKSKQYEEYCVGRIDIHVPNEPYNREYGVNVMTGYSWRKLGQFLNKLKTKEVLSLEEIYSRFERETNHKIQWFKS